MKNLSVVEDDSFYRAFEERYRGPRELIKARLSVYLPFIEPLQEIYPEMQCLDIGCGRGEWLEVLENAGIRALGVDLDGGMLEACRALGLKAEHADGIAYIRTLADESLGVISAFHVVEHLPFDQLRVFVSEAFRVLKPGGLLIMETPNPENIAVGACKFYLDPTHERPIPAELLSFLPEYYGYVRTKILFLQESAGLAERDVLSIEDVITGVSPDYAVVAQKGGIAAAISLLNKCFAGKYGLNLNALAKKYDWLIEKRIIDIESHLLSKSQQAENAEARARQFEERALAEAHRAEEANERAHQFEEKALFEANRAALLEERALQAEKRLRIETQRREQSEALANRMKENLSKESHRADTAEARAQQAELIYVSTSWRVTAPLRVASRFIGVSRDSKIRPVLRDPIGCAALYIGRRPRLKKTLAFIGFKSKRHTAIEQSAQSPNLKTFRNQGIGKIIGINSHAEELSVEEILRRVRKEVENGKD